MVMMVMLKYLGTEGSGGSRPALRNMFGIGRGTVHNYCGHVPTALRSFWSDVIHRPDENDMFQIKIVLANVGDLVAKTTDIRFL